MYDEDETGDNWWKRDNIKDANGDPVPNKLSFEASVDVMIEEINNGSNVYWDWKNNANRKQDLIALRAYVKMFYDRAQTESDVPENVLL